MNKLLTHLVMNGYGGTGLKAMIEARRQGLNVILVSKSKTSLANCTASAMEAFKVSKEKDSEKHFQETLEAGRFLNNPSMDRTLVARA